MTEILFPDVFQVLSILLHTSVRKNKSFQRKQNMGKNKPLFLVSLSRTISYNPAQFRKCNFHFFLFSMMNVVMILQVMVNLVELMMI